MNLTQKIITGTLLVCAAAWNAHDETRGQNWQPAGVTEDRAVSANWEQRVLKRPRQLQWQDPQASMSTAAPAVGYQTQNAFNGVQQTSYNRSVYGPVSTPRYRTPAAGHRVAWNDGNQPEVIPPGVPQEQVTSPEQTQFEPIASDGAFANGGCASCGGGGQGMDCDGCGPSCDACCGPACGECCDFGWECFDGRCGPWLRGLSVFAGVDGFKGPLDRGTNGNFGLNEGLNLARPLGDPWGCGYQIGANFVQSDFSGAPTLSIGDRTLRAPFRRQYFATAGIFRRADPCGGLQWGVVYDYLHDVYYQNANLQQIRSETSWVIDDVYEIGYYGAYGVFTDTDRVIDGKLDATDMFVLFVRRNFEHGGDGRLWFGATGNGDGLLGATLWVPLGRSLALENRANYLIPKGGQDVAQPRESWGLVMQLVWYPGQNALCQRLNPYRPVFNVADNSLFMVDRLAR